MKKLRKGVSRDHYAAGGVNDFAEPGCGVHAVNVAVQTECEDVSHFGVDFEGVDDGEPGIAECVREFSLFPAAGVLGKADAVESNSPGFFDELFRQQAAVAAAAYSVEV